MLRMRLPRHARYARAGDKVMVRARFGAAPERLVGHGSPGLPGTGSGRVVADIDVAGWEISSSANGPASSSPPARGAQSWSRRTICSNGPGDIHAGKGAGEWSSSPAEPAPTASRSVGIEAGDILQMPEPTCRSESRADHRAFIASPDAAAAHGLAGRGRDGAHGAVAEEEPQISVPMVDIHIRADGLKAVDAIELVTKPLETIVKGINGVEHVYSQTEDDQVIVTARFFVGTSEDTAILRVHEEIRANLDRMPLGISNR
jgi:hypothetical protein